MVVDVQSRMLLVAAESATSDRTSGIVTPSVLKVNKISENDSSQVSMHVHALQIGVAGKHGRKFRTPVSSHASRHYPRFIYILIFKTRLPIKKNSLVAS